MANFTKYILPGLGMAAGTVASALGIRAGIRWWQNRQERGRMQVSGYRPPVRQAIPATGAEPGPAAGAHVMSPPVQEPPPVGQASTSWEPAEPSPMMYDVDQERLKDAPRAQPVEQERMHQAPEKDAADSGTTVSDPSINMDTLVAPLVDYLMAFNSMISVLRSQQETGAVSSEQEMTLGEREGMRNVLEQVEDRLPPEAERQLKSGSLEARTYRLAARIRDALSNLESTDSEFLRLYDELHPEICSLAQAIQQSGSVSITGMDQVREMYECR